MADHSLFMTLSEAEELSRDLAAKIRLCQPDLLVGLANGALLPTKIAADSIQTPYEIIHVRRRATRYKHRAYNLLRVFRIPTTIFHWGPFRWLIIRMVNNRYRDLEQADNSFTFSVKGKHIVIVDDVVHTGASVNHVRDQLIKEGAARITVAVLYWYQGFGDSGEWAPDIYLNRGDGRWYPWSFNSPYHKDYLEWLAAHDLVASA